MTKSHAGCQTCKIRRIKCDGAKPVCARCAKSSRLCLETSVVKAACFSINVENRFASGKIKRPRGPRSSLTLRRPHIDLSTRAVAYYVKHYLQLPQTTSLPCGALSECIWVWQTSGRSSSVVDLAISSIALAIFARIQHHPSAMLEATTKYSHLLKTMQKYITSACSMDIDSWSIDACLLTIFIMSRFEGITYCNHISSSQFSLRSLNSWHHHDGSMAVLRYWYDRSINREATPIIKHTRRGLIRSTILREISLPKWITDGSCFGEEGIGLAFDRILVQLTTMRRRISTQGLQIDFQPENAQAMSEEIKELDQALQTWIAQKSQSTQYRKHILENVEEGPKKHLYSPVVYSFSQVDEAGLWAQYFSTRMLVHSTHVALLENCTHRVSSVANLARLKRGCLKQLKTMSESLASTIPFCLGKLNCGEHYSAGCELRSLPFTDEGIAPHMASLVVWPLTIATRIKEIDRQQLQWFKSELASMGIITGDAVLENATTDRWAGTN